MTAIALKSQLTASAFLLVIGGKTLHQHAMIQVEVQPQVELHCWEFAQKVTSFLPVRQREALLESITPWQVSLAPVA